MSKSDLRLLKKRWTFQILNGLLFAVVMAIIFNIVYIIMQPSLIDWNDVLIEFIIQFLGGTFILGYFMWKINRKYAIEQ